MVVYIEYAFLWNFALDFVLLWLSLLAVKRKIGWGRLSLAALVGALFALLFPLLSLPRFLSYLLKFSVGCLLSLIAFGFPKNKKERGMYALNCALFFSFTFAFGGAILALFGDTPKKGFVLLTVAILSGISLFLIEKLYQKRAIHRYIYPCTITCKEKQMEVSGFYDSGNLATYKGIGICFVAPDVFYELWGEERATYWEGKGETVVCQTINGVKKTIVCLGKLNIEIGGESLQGEVYFAPSTNMVLREYKLLLSSHVFEHLDKINEKRGKIC